ncbi:S-layer homology domain-containing protein [Paenibacillus sp. URB8-2]|uniref:S-layer homology domain-containing protein n=1 Tax=Paenibacillus sp. URB8-2 TaxID=2741301 RepID=UPI0015BA259D|nr:S-layer homology domain-containing protein [Paenibacillus sp. URB8-2]BCG57414.1 hypothetical protein PUR_08390 [Paenibacillus sp. URB8-2]
MKNTAFTLIVFIIVALLTPTFPQAEAASPILFSDISPKHWAHQEISRLKEQQLIGGYDDGTFRPDNPITRAEAVKIIVQASGIGVDSNGDDPQAISDVSSEYWAYPYIKAAKKSNLITGYADGTFRPGETLTRADSAVLIARAFNLDSQGANAAAHVSDIDNHWAASSISRLVTNGIAAGDENGKFQPSKMVTRSEFAALLGRTLYQDLRIGAAGSPDESAPPPVSPSASPEGVPASEPAAAGLMAAIGGGGGAGGGGGGGGAAPPVAPAPSPSPLPTPLPSASADPAAAAPAPEPTPTPAPEPAPAPGMTPAPEPTPAPSEAPVLQEVSGLKSLSGKTGLSFTWFNPAYPDFKAVNIYKEGSLKAATTDTFYQETGLLPGTTHHYVLKTVNMTGMESAGTELSVTTAPASLPSPPAGLSASASDGAVLLNWTENGESSIIGYNVYRDGTKSNTATVTGDTYMLNGLKNGQSYSLYVTAVNDAQIESGPSIPISATPQAADDSAPEEISGLTAVDDGTSVTLTWNNPASPNFNRVDIYLGGVLIGSSSDGRYKAEGLSGETEYSFTLKTVYTVVKTSNGIGLSIRTKDIVPPATPAQVSAAGGPSKVSISWAAGTESDLAGYNIYVGGQKVNAEPLLQNFYEAKGLDFGVAYTVQLEAVDTSGNRSPLSAPVSASPTHYLIELARWGIYNDGTHPVETVKGINNALIWARQKGITATTLPPGTYLIDKNSRIAMVGDMLFDLPMDAVLQKETNGKERYDVMYVGYGANNVTLRGGTYIGDKQTHDYSQRDPYNTGTHEGGYGIFVEGAKNTTIDGVKAMYFTGDGLVLGGFGTMFKDLYAASFVSGGIGASGQPIGDSTKVRTKDGIYFNNAIFKTERTFEISNIANLPSNFTVYFYRTDGSFIKSQPALAREIMTIPDGAAYFHLVFIKASSTGAYLEAWNRTVTQNPVVKNSEFAYNRRQGITVGGADNALIMNNILHDIKGIAPQSGIDVEGGYGENGNLNTNIFIKNNEFYNNAVYDVILYDGHDATVEGNHLASKGTIGLAVSETFKNAKVVNNHFDATRIIAYHDASFLGNRMNDSGTFFQGPNIVIDGMEITNGKLSVSAKNPKGVKVSNVNIQITKKVDAGFAVSGEPIEVSNVTVTGEAAFASFNGNPKPGSAFNNIKVLGFNSAQGMTLPQGMYTNSIFEAADGSRFGSTIVASGVYSFDNCTFASNATGNNALIASHANLDLKITNSKFNVKGDASAITVETANRVVLENNTVTAMKLARTSVELIKINDYWKRNDPADVFNVSIISNTVTSNIAAVGISTIYAGTNAPPYTVKNNILNKAVLALKSNDVQSGNIQQ